MVATTTTTTTSSNGNSTTQHTTTSSKRQQISDEEIIPQSKRIKGGHEEETQEKEPVITSSPPEAYINSTVIQNGVLNTTATATALAQAATALQNSQNLTILLAAAAVVENEPSILLDPPESVIPSQNVSPIPTVPPQSDITAQNEPQFPTVSPRVVTATQIESNDSMTSPQALNTFQNGSDISTVPSEASCNFQNELHISTPPSQVTSTIQNGSHISITPPPQVSDTFQSESLIPTSPPGVTTFQKKHNISTVSSQAVTEVSTIPHIPTAPSQVPTDVSNGSCISTAPSQTTTPFENGSNVSSIPSKAAAATPPPPKIKDNEFPRRPTKIALYQKATDGYFFSSTRKRTSLKNSKLYLAGDIRPVAIIPTQSLDENTVPTLGSVLPATHQIKVQHKPEIVLPGVKTLNYGPYSSFAPTFDTANSMVSLEDIALLQHPKYGKNEYQSRNHSDSFNNDNVANNKKEISDNTNMNNSVSFQNGMLPSRGIDKAVNEVANVIENFTQPCNDNEMEIDNQLFLEEGIDVGLLLKALENEENQVKTSDKDKLFSRTDENSQNQINKELEENAALICELQRLQEERFSQDPDYISPREREIASILEKTLVNLTLQVPPFLLVSLQDIEKTASQIPLKEPAFKGGLPPNKPYGYPTNNGDHSGLITNATAVPPSQVKIQIGRKFQPVVPIQSPYPISNPSLSPNTYTRPSGHPINSNHTVVSQLPYKATSQSQYPTAQVSGYISTHQVSYPIKQQAQQTLYPSTQQQIQHHSFTQQTNNQHPLTQQHQVSLHSSNQQHISQSSSNQPPMAQNSSNQQPKHNSIHQQIQRASTPPMQQTYPKTQSSFNSMNQYWYPTTIPNGYPTTQPNVAKPNQTVQQTGYLTTPQAQSVPQPSAPHNSVPAPMPGSNAISIPISLAIWYSNTRLSFSWPYVANGSWVLILLNVPIELLRAPLLLLVRGRIIVF
ncbi:hypothetical protein G9A89_015446 [Geosiphon pyriformis]|nr:hypothetical protein G9A89_015446 [Geosiphon pyriformis]